jgi:hypothetical protein
MSNLKPGFDNDILSANITILQEEIDRAWDLKESESTEESYTIPIVDNVGNRGADKETCPSLRGVIDEKNEISRRRQMRLLRQPKLLVRR